MKNKVVIITGGSSGLGKALVELALARGAKVAVCARNLEKLQMQFTPSGRLLYYKADVSAEADCKSFIDAVVQRWGVIDVLINNVGIGMRTLFLDTDLAVMKELMDVNFWGAVYCTRCALPALIKHKGVIASVSSIAGYRGLPGRSGYSASKFAMQGFFESLRTELLHTGVHVMWVAPGFIASSTRNAPRISEGAPQAENKLMTAEECASIIINGIEKRKRTIVMTAKGKLVVWINKLLPDLADKLAYNHFVKEPASLKEVKK